MSPSIDQFATEIARRLDTHERQIKVLSNKSDLGKSSFENGSVDAYTAGQLALKMGRQYDGSTTAAPLSGPLPPQPSAAFCTGGITAVIRWDGFFYGSQTIVAPMDFSRVEIHASQDATYTAETAETLRDTFESPRGGEKTISLPEGTWFIRLVTRTMPGNRSAASAVVSVVVEDRRAADIQAKLDAATAELRAADVDLTAALDLSVQEQAALATSLSDLKNVTIPKLNTDLTAAQGRLDTAEGDIADAFTSLGEVPGQIDAAKVEAVDLAAITAQQKADAAVAAAAADATAKADAAEAAAITAATTAAAADATAKAEAAEANAAATAALDAQAKADAAQAAAVAAANTYAEAQASGAGTDALEAAKLDATAKADAAEAAAIAAAALDATAKKEQAEATAAADAKAKADAALAAAKTDAQAKADAAQAAAVTAAAADATAKAETAEANAAATAAADAQTKADAAQAAAVAAANTYAEAQASGAGTAALDAAKLDATAKADAAEAAAVAAAALDATAKAEKAEADAAVDASTKADAALAAAQADATAKADAAQAAALATALSSATRYLNPGTDAGTITRIQGVPAAVVDSPTAMGGKALLKTGAAHGWWEDRRSIQPIDPNVLYRVTARVRVVKASTTGSTHAFYFGAVGYADAEASVWVNATGGDSYSSQQWTTGGYVVPQTGEWIDVVGYYKGFSAGNSSGAGTLAQPRTFQAATKYFALGTILDYNNGNGDWELSHMAVEAIDAVGQQALADAASARARAEAVKTEAAADATAKANAAETGAVSQMGYLPNPTFSNWTGLHPVGFGNWQGTPVKEKSLTQYPPFAARFNVATSTEQSGMYIAGLGTAPNLEYWTVEVDLYLVSGSLGGSGIILDWSGMTGGIRSTVNFLDEIPGASTGKWYRVNRVVRRPTTATGTLTAMSGYLMAQWTGHAGAAAKEIVYDRFDLRPSTAEEITAYKAPADAAAKADAALAAAKTDATTKADAAREAAKTAAATDASSKAATAESNAKTAAAADAQTKADAAKQAAIDSAAATAAGLASEAETAAKTAAATDAQNKADAAQAAAEAAASTDAQTKADAARAAAEAAAATDASTKADAALAAAKTDATNKANAAKTDAIAAAKTETTNQISVVNNSILGRSFYGTAAPTTTAPVAKEGETYRRKNSLGQIFEEYVRTSTGWTIQKITGTTITALDVGQLSAGSASILEAVAQKIAASTATFQKADIGNLTVTDTSALNDVVAQKIAAGSGRFVELDVSQLRASTAVIPVAVIDRLFSDVVKARTVEATEAFIGTNAIITDSITAPKIAASEELWAKLGTFVTIESGMITTGALDGKLITGAVVRTAATGARVQIDQNGLFAYDANNVETARINGTQNLLSGQFYTGGEGKPGIILVPSTSLGKPAVWFSADGGLGGNHAAILIDSNWNMVLRGNIPDGSTTRRSVIVEGSLVSDSIGSYTRNVWNISQDGNAFLTSVNAESAKFGPGLAGPRHVEITPNFSGIYLRTSGGTAPSYRDGAVYTADNNSPMYFRGPRRLTDDVHMGFRFLDGPLEYYNPPTSTFTANVGISSSPKDRFYKLTSASKYKLAQQEQDLEKAKLLLNVLPKTWFDKHQAESYADYLDGKGSLDDVPTLRRIPGVVAEDVLAAGLDEYVTYDAEGVIEGVAYDRLWTLLILLVKDLYGKIA